MTFPVASLLIPLLLGAGFALVYVPLSMFIKSWLQDSQDAPASDRKGAAISREEARDLLLQLRAVTSNVSRDVSAHSAEMDTISHDLEGGEAPTTAKMLAAMEHIIQANATLKSQLDKAKATIDEQAALIGKQLAAALTDALTSIPNRRAFDQEFHKRLAEYRRDERPFCVVMCDVDRFKRVNDAYGHVVGDHVLKEIASRVTSTVRKVDLPARYGGEEFAVLLPNTCTQDATIVVERIRTAICEKPVVWESQDLTVTASFGLTECLDGDETESSIIKRADEALYASKNAGRNCSHLHNGRACVQIGDFADRETLNDPENRVPNQEDTTKLASALCDGQGDNQEEPQPVNESRILPRELFDLEVAERVMLFRRDGGAMSAILLEVDDYDRVSTEAEASGLPVMVALAQLITAAVGPSGVPARYSDRQFAALLYNANIDDAIRLASRLQRAISSCDFLNGPNARVSVAVSIGVTTAEADDFPSGMYRRMELALREASHAGGRCVYVHHGDCVAPAEEVGTDGGTSAVPV